MWRFATVPVLAACLALPPAGASAQTDCFETVRQAPDSAAAAAAIWGAGASDCWYTLHVQAVRVTDSCAGQRAAAIDPTQVAAWIAKANEVYAAARIRFEFDPTPKTGDWSALSSDDVNDLEAERPGDPTWEHGKAAANELAARFPRKVLVLFRHGPDDRPTGGGFSSTTYDFVVLPGYQTTSLCGATTNPYLFAHELGHYFGLQHTFRPFPTKAAAAAAFERAGKNPKFFDGDGLAETPPEPYIEELQCGTDTSVTLDGVRFSLLRDNIMSYYASPTKTLDPKQVSIVRWWLARRFGNALSGRGPYVPDDRVDYQFVAVPNGKTLSTPGAKGNGAIVFQADWTGAAGQMWRFVPLVAADAGWYEIVSADGGKCLTIAEGSGAEGARLVVWDWLGADNQKWRLLSEPNGQLRIEAKHSLKVLTLAPGPQGDGAPIMQATDQGRPDQRWLLLPAR
ncbi:MAG: RICIN domain-containing protein [Hyphomicrobiales bacterium]